MIVQIDISFLLLVITGFFLGSLIVYGLDFIISKLQQRKSAMLIAKEVIKEAIKEEKSETSPPTIHVSLINVLSFIQLAMSMRIFTLENIVEYARIPKETAIKLTNEAVRAGILEEYWYRKRKVYRLNPEAKWYREFARISTICAEGKKLSLKGKLIKIGRNLREKLIGQGIKNIFYIEFNEEEGPELKYFIDFSELICLLLEESKYITDISLLSKTSPMMLIKGTKIIISQVITKPHERELENQLCAEIFEDSDEKLVAKILENISKSLSGKKIVSEKDFLEALKSIEKLGA